MPPIDFPASPAVNDEYTFENRTWVWNGTGWEAKTFASPALLYNRRPPLHRHSLFFKTSSTAISIIANSVLNGYYYGADTSVTMPSHTNNTDYAIWQNLTTGALVADSSFTTAPAGATGGSIVGGYHYIPSGRPTAFNNGSPTGAAEILEYSLWDLTWRPVCQDPRGMTCVDKRFWADIYLCGTTSYQTSSFTGVPSSRNGLTIADGSSAALIPATYGGNGSTVYTLTGGNGIGSWYNFAEVASSFGKRLPSSWEFQALAFGGIEAASRGTDPVTVTWERASLWGCAQATGVAWAWGIERQGRYVSVTNTNTGGRGTELNDNPIAPCYGGAWQAGNFSGSRSSNWSNAPSNSAEFIGARFVAEHVVLA
jgi:hypothetical protein